MVAISLQSIRTAVACGISSPWNTPHSRSTKKLFMYKSAAGILAMLWILSLITSCSPVKQVLKSPDRTQKVISEWLKNNPIKNDTTYIEDSVVSTKADTTYLPSIQAYDNGFEFYPFQFIDSLRKADPGLFRKYFQPDTVRITKTLIKEKTKEYRVDDRTFVNAVMHTNKELQAEHLELMGRQNELREQNKSYRKEASKWKWYFFGSWALFVVLVVLYMYIKFKSAPLKLPNILKHVKP
jgi:hypothetical protein